MIRKPLKVPRLKALRIVLAAMAFLAFLAFFMEAKAGRELSRAHELLSLGAADEAEIHLFRAVNWYSPLGSSQKAIAELARLASNYAARGQDDEALRSYLRLRAAIVAARSFYMPQKRTLETANSNIARYLARQRLGKDADHEALARETARYGEIYAKAPSMNEGWYLVAVGGFLMWTLCGLAAIFRLFRADGQSAGVGLAKARTPLAGFVLGYALWIIGMAMA
ncbi:MAG: hypothetical protein LBR80_18645 [Deltaproteobacteria bacterium]|jgi:hypothetical protein|nr:hypothetical protein [Deltaproteobacteria bacterium]